MHFIHHSRRKRHWHCGADNDRLDGGELLGELILTAAFGSGNNGTLTSEVTNFYHQNDGAYTGTLTGTGDLFQNLIPATHPQVQADLVGTLSNGGMDYAANLTLNGYFLDNGADRIGAIAGTADGIFDGGLFAGEFAAERQVEQNDTQER